MGALLVLWFAFCAVLAVTSIETTRCDSNGIGDCYARNNLCDWYHDQRWILDYENNHAYLYTTLNSRYSQTIVTSGVSCAPARTDDHCIKFEYKLESSVAKLTVFLRIPGTDHELWTMRGSDRNTNTLYPLPWSYASMSFTTDTDFYLVIQASYIGTSQSRGIWFYLRNIVYRKQNCNFQPPAAKPATTTTTTTTTTTKTPPTTSTTTTSAFTTTTTIITEPPTVTAVTYTTLQTQTSSVGTANPLSSDRNAHSKPPRSTRAEESDSNSTVIAVVVSLVLAVVVVVAVAVFIFKRRQMACLKTNFLQRQFHNSGRTHQRFSSGADAETETSATRSIPLYAVVKKAKKHSLVDNHRHPFNPSSTQPPSKSSVQPSIQSSNTEVSIYQIVQNSDNSHSNGPDDVSKINTNGTDYSLGKKQQSYSEETVTNENDEMYFVLDKDPDDDDDDDFDDDEVDDGVYNHPVEEGACNIEGSTSVYDVIGETVNQNERGKCQRQPTSIYHIIGETQEPGSADLQDHTPSAANQSQNRLQHDEYSVASMPKANKPIPKLKPTTKSIPKSTPDTKNIGQTKQSNKPRSKTQTTKKPIREIHSNTKPIPKPQQVKTPAQSNVIYHTVGEKTAGGLQNNTNDATLYYNVTNSAGASSLHVNTDDHNYNVLDFQDGRGAGAASKSSEGGEGEDGQVCNHLDDGKDGQVYNHLDEGKGGQVYNHVNEGKDGQVYNHLDEGEDGQVYNHVNEGKDGQVYNHLDEGKDGQVYNHLDEGKGGQVYNHLDEGKGGQVYNHMDEGKGGQVYNHLDEGEDGQVYNHLDEGGKEGKYNVI